MAATLAQDASLAADATFRSRCQAAMMRYLLGLLADTSTMTSSQVALARAMIYDPATYGAIVASGIVTTAAINARDGVQTNVLDSEITSAVSTLLVRYVR